MLGTMLTAFGCLVTWCIVGELPTTVTAPGVVVRPRRVVDVQSQATGKLVTFALRVGDIVRKGDVLGVIDQGEILRQVQEDRARLAALESQNRRRDTWEQQQLRLATRDAEARKKALAMQVASRVENLKTAEALAPMLKARVTTVTEAVKRGIEPRMSPALVETQRQFNDNENRISELRADITRLDGEIEELETSLSEERRTFLDAATLRTNQLLDARKAIALGDVQLERNTQIVAANSGRVVEISATLGQVLMPGARLASIELEEEGADLVCVAYFPVRDGKRLRPGMTLQVTPDTVKRERFGAIVGTVVSVSSFPVTREGAALLVGNPSLASLLVGDGPHIEVVAELQRDPSTVSGYRWSSSKGPGVPVTAGTTTSCRAIVEMRAPITYILPFLRAASGIN